MPLKTKARKSTFVVGLMSGTSADGIDAVVTRISPKTIGVDAQVDAHHHQAYPPDLRRRILKISLHGTVAEICTLNFELGEHFAKAALTAIRKARLSPKQITAVASHGQTVHHLPWAKPSSTLQIGESSVIAERTGITTVSDFRTRDMAAGGQGAPLVPYVDWLLFTDRSRPSIVQNIGGIGNLTFLPAAAELKDIWAFDTGPGNMVIDGIVEALSKGRQSFDEGGKRAARGKISPELLRELMKHSFLSRRPPKTTGREEFGESFVAEVIQAGRRRKLTADDLVATITSFTAASIVGAYESFVFAKCSRREIPRLRVILGGGGAKNPTLRRMLAERLARHGITELLTHEDLGIANFAKEALAFAILGYETLRGRPSNVPGATGAKRPVVLGKILPGGSGINWLDTL